jgi:nucleotide-binding universal stress UspA family protein
MTIYVVGVDGSDTAATCAERAGALAHAAGASIHVVCAYSDHRHGPTVVAAAAEPEGSTLLNAEAIVEDEVARLRAAGVTATSAIREGKPADVLLEEAAAVDADLIVVGNRRMQGVGRLLGSVASHVAHHAPCDVLIVKTV